MERGDWDGFFACFDRDDLLKIAENSLKMILLEFPAVEVAFTALCAAQPVPVERFTAVRTVWQRIQESAAAPAGSRGAHPDPQAMREDSQRHMALVQESQKILKDGLRAAPDLARFTAGLERMMRADGGGGSVSSRLLVGETLEDLTISGTKAWATRQMASGATEDLGFVRRKDGWYLRLFAKRPRRKG
jgi:hypothetical protein